MVRYTYVALPGTDLPEGWLCHRASLDAVVNRKNIDPA